jgi:PKD repeat protein
MSACLALPVATSPSFASTTTSDKTELFGGEQAIEALGSDLSTVASAYGLSASDLREHLEEDPALRLDVFDRLLYVDEMLAAPDTPNPEMIDTSSGWSYAGIDYTAVDAFELHSRPTATKRIYLDFNGHTTTGTHWNTTYGASLTSAPLDYDGNPNTFNAAERTVIGKVWSGVAEDFAPFDVDVTTEAPPVDDLRKMDAGDTRYGIRIVITPTAFISAGGVAYLNSFDWNSDTPAFCFGANYTVDQMILVISHEAGHTFGLQHDGTSSNPYYSGHGNWGPIMGAPYGKAVAQWSKGEYQGANNTSQDDVALIAAYVPYVEDDFSNTMQGARTIQALSTPGLISSATDEDWFKFSFPSGALRVQLTPTFNPNFDGAVEIWRSGSLVSRLDPASLTIDTILEALPADEYFVKVEGAGFLNPFNTGYSKYGSIGEYRLTFTGNVSTDPPATIALAASKSFALAGDDVTFSVSSSSHPTFDGVSLAWSFSDGSTASGASVTKSMPSSAPSLSATVVATTSNGGVSTKTVQVRRSRPPTVSAAVTPSLAKAGAMVMFSANGQDPDSQAVTYAWTFSDGTTATGASVTKTSATVRVLSGTVTITDADGNTASASTEASFVANLPPSVVASVSPTSAAVPATIAFAGSGVDPEGSALTYRWEFSDGTTASTARVSKVISQAGAYTGTLTVSDREGISASKTVTFTGTANGAPVISSATVSSATVAAPASLFFTTVASDPNRHPMTYAWAFSDGTSATGARVVKTFATPGSYTATVTVSDSGGLTATRDVPFTVTTNSAPSVTVSSGLGFSLASPATFGLRAAGVDPDKQPMTYRWSFSDGTSATGVAATKNFTTPGTYTATVTVTDTGGLTGSATVTMTVSPNTAPTVSGTVNASSLAAPAMFALNAVGTDIDKQALTYRWAFSDGTSASTASVSKRFTTVGNHTATVTVRDAGGLTASKVFSLTVTANRAPTVSASAPALTLVAPASFALSAVGSDADNQTLTYRWAFSDGSSSSAASLVKKISTPGTYTATVTATDPGGLRATQSLSLVVTANIAPAIASAQVSLPVAASGVSRSFFATASDPENQSISYVWRFPDGTTARGSSATKVFTVRGSFVARLTVTDAGGMASTREVPFTVS